MPINSQAKGKRAERDLAKWLRTHGYPDAERAVKTGTTQTHDAGDLILECDGFRLCVEVKHYAGGLSDREIIDFGEKLMRQVRQSRSNLGVLIERRDRAPEPARWNAYLDAEDFALLKIPRLENFGFEFLPHERWEPVRVPVGYLARLLREAGLARPLERVASSAASDSRRSGTAAERPQAVGGT